MAKEFEYVFDVVGATSGEDRQELVNDEPRDKVVYLHRRADDLQPFYIGIGSLKRANDVCSRNYYWTNVYKKHGRIVEILYSDLTSDEACELEIRLIKEYRSKYPDSMTNLSDGGEGGFGLTGEDHGQFKGHVLLLSLCGGYYFICSGSKELEDTGFGHGDVYSIILGSKNCEYVTSKKIHVDGAKIRFKPVRFNNESEIDDSMLVNRIESVVCASEVGGNTGVNNPNFIGYALGVNQSQFVLLSGEKDMKTKEFHNSSISACILGKRQTHRGFKWFRVDGNITKESLKTLRDLQPYDEDSESRLNQLLNE